MDARKTEKPNRRNTTDNLKQDEDKLRRTYEKVNIIFGMAKFDFRLKCYTQMFAHLSHNIGKTIIGKFAVKIKYLCCMIVGSK